jgi:diguanylate cyclase (GGDEF)-like protein
LTIINVAGAVLLGTIVLGIVYNVLNRRMETEYVAKGNAVARVVAYMVNGETVDRYLSALETDAEYEIILSHLRIMQTEHDLLYVCVIRMTQDGEVLVFGTGEVEEGTSALGVFISWVDAFGEGHNDYINALLNGEKVGTLVSNGVYGHILSVYEPIYRTDGTVAAYACVDISINKIEQDEKLMFILVGIGMVSVLVLTIVTSLFTFHKYILSPVSILLERSESVHAVGSSPAKDTPLQARLRFGDEMAVLERAIVDMEQRIHTEVAERRKIEERMKLMLDATPLGCQIIDNNLIIIDCNEAAVKLFEFSNKQELIERWLEDSNPEYQPDGQRSDEKRYMFRKKAIEEGSCTFEWMHRTPDGLPLPAEVTLTRVKYENTFVLLRYTRDLREIKKMAENVLYLKTEAQKIYLDPLTDIYNRRYLDENLKRIISLLSRSCALMSLMMIDIDYFKRYNDTYGHARGDECLKTVAATLKSSLKRADDFVVRYGGEEFTVVLPNTGEDGARLIAGKLLKNIQRQAIPHETSDAASHVTISIGVCSGTVGYTHSADYWLRLADEMLYKSKQEGRNRFTFKTADGSL